MKLATWYMSIFILLLATSLSAQTQPQIFYVNVYEGIYPDIMNAYGANTTGATNHWTSFGLPGGRRASITFDPVYYLNHNPDLAAAYGITGYAAAANHFINQGLPVEGRRGSLEFDVKYYLAHNSDLAAAYGTNYRAAADHFVGTGLPSEGRQGSPDFNVKDYINNYPDVAAGYGTTDYMDATLHWLRRGKAFGRQGFGAVPASTDCGDGHTTEFVTLPAAAASPSPTPSPTPITISVSHAGAPGFANTSVQYVNPPTGFPGLLTAVGSNPARGQYTVAGGVYSFNYLDAEAPLQISYSITPIPPGFSRIFFDLHTSNGDGSMAHPFNGSIMDVTLRHISEQSGVVPNNENGGGAAYGPYNLIVCLNDTGTFSTLGYYDYVIAQFPQNHGHSTGNPDAPPTFPAGFSFNNNWHIHGKGMWATTLQLSGTLLNPTVWGFPSGTALGRILGSHGDDVGGVEISDLTLDDNYSGVRGSTPTNLEAIFLRGDLGNNYIHNINVTNPSGETGIEAFPILIQAINNKSPLTNANNQVKYVLMGGLPPTGMCTGIAIDNAQTEVAYNVVNSWGFGGFGHCNGYGGWDMDSSWFHDNFAFNNTPAGFLDDSLTNRNVTVEFNQIINPQTEGILVGGGGIYDYYTIQWNTIQLGQYNTAGILFNGDVVGATVTRNNITVSGSPGNTNGIWFGDHSVPPATNTGNVFQYNQISSHFGNRTVPAGNCVFSNWNENGVQLSNFPNTQSSPCAAPAQPYATMQTDGNFVIYGPAGVALWSTQTNGSGGAIIKMQDDGNLVIYAEVWQAGTYATPTPGPFPTQTCSIGTILHAPQDLLSNQCIVSPKGQYILLMGAPAGPLFIYDIAHNVGTWGAPGSNNGGVKASLQSDGNFVVYNSSNTALWSSGTYGTGANLLDMEDDGRIILYRPVWQSNTGGGWNFAPVNPHPACDVGLGTGWTGVLGVGQCFVSPNGRFELLLQSDGELEILDRSVTPNKVLWSN